MQICLAICQFVFDIESDSFIFASVCIGVVTIAIAIAIAIASACKGYTFNIICVRKF